MGKTIKTRVRNFISAFKLGLQHSLEKHPRFRACIQLLAAICGSMWTWWGVAIVGAATNLTLELLKVQPSTLVLVANSLLLGWNLSSVLWIAVHERATKWKVERARLEAEIKVREEWLAHEKLKHNINQERIGDDAFKSYTEYFEKCRN